MAQWHSGPPRTLVGAQNQIQTRFKIGLVLDSTKAPDSVSISHWDPIITFSEY